MMLLNAEIFILFIMLTGIEILAIVDYKMADPIKSGSATYLLIITTSMLLFTVANFIKEEIIVRRHKRLIDEQFKLFLENSELRAEKYSIKPNERLAELLLEREYKIKELITIVEADLAHPRYSSNKVYSRKEKQNVKRKLYNEIAENKKEYILEKANSLEQQ